MNVDGGLVTALHARLVDSADPESAAGAEARLLAPLLSPSGHRQLVSRALSHLRGLGALDALLADPAVCEVMVNRGTEVWVERNGTVSRADPIPPGQLELIVERVLGPLGRRLDRLHPAVDARLTDGSRLCAVLPPIAVDGPCLAIRRFPAAPLPTGAFGGDDVRRVLATLVRERRNVVVTGATSSGKTTLLGALCGLVPAGERIITMEDTAELRIDHPHVVRLETRDATAEGAGEVGLYDLVRMALRLRPDRLVVGEVRGPEALALVQALNTGHDGSLTTLHSNGPADALARLRMMVAQAAPGWSPDSVAESVWRGVDAVVDVHRRPDGARVVAEVCTVGHGGSMTTQWRRGAP